MCSGCGVVMYLVAAADGQCWLDVQSGQEHHEAFGLVIAMPLPEGERRAALMETLRETGYTQIFDPASGGVETQPNSRGRAVARC